ncbi:MAG: hypothetical protein AMJ90_06625 [candidate division Zixibacteria bacterium SM23_73_2]|nr:MAG: hypothetical protein AMJ90_06625 [candidate division Zixibacteria bacterium SM23_73_2]
MKYLLWLVKSALTLDRNVAGEGDPAITSQKEGDKGRIPCLAKRSEFINLSCFQPENKGIIFHIEVRVGMLAEVG